MIRKDRKLLSDAIAQGIRTAAELAAYLRSLETSAKIRMFRTIQA